MDGIGEILRQARERKGAALDQIEEATKIKKRYLLALEHEEWDRMPGRVYAKGFLRSYARYLGLDEKILADMFELSMRDTGRESAREAAKAPASPAASQKSASFPKGEGAGRRREVDLKNKPKLRTVLILCLLSALILYFAQWAYKTWYLAGREENDPGPSGIITLPPTEVGPTWPTAEPETEPVIPLSFTLELVATEDCWLRLRDQEQQIYEGTLRTGETIAFPELQKIELRLGNAGGVVIILNGLELPSQGQSGQIITKLYSIAEGVLYDDETGEAIS
jgi:cytoskeletal protein RodZ